MTTLVASCASLSCTARLSARCRSWSASQRAAWAACMASAAAVCLAATCAAAAFSVAALAADMSDSCRRSASYMSTGNLRPWTQQARNSTKGLESMHLTKATMHPPCPWLHQPGARASLLPWHAAGPAQRGHQTAALPPAHFVSWQGPAEGIQAMIVASVKYDRHGENHSSFCKHLHLEPRLLPLAAGLELRRPHCMLDGLRCRCAGGAPSISCCPVCCYAILPERCQLLVMLLHIGDDHMVDHTSYDGRTMTGTSESQENIVPLVLSAWRMSHAAAAAAGLLHDLQLHPQQQSGPHQPQPPCDHAQLYFHAAEPAAHMAP